MSHRNQVVFICNRCHVDVNWIQSQDTSAYDNENEAMLQKTRMLVSSRSLRFAIEHRDRIRAGFAIGNRNGPASLLESLDEEVDEDAEAAWAAEITKRVDDLDSGRVVPVPWAEARRKIMGR